MNSKLLSRKQYDLLVTYCKNWMDLRWKEYRKQWSLGGVLVTGNIENLQAQLDYCELAQKGF